MTTTLPTLPAALPDHAEHFQDLETQAHAARFGTWVFLGSELLLFAGLFALYGSYRAQYLDGFHEGVRETSLALGTTNTFVLMTSSLLVALGVHAAEEGRNRRTSALLGVAVVLGGLFVVLKLVEWSDHVARGLVPGGSAVLQTHEKGAMIFWTLYYAMTGLHALHVIVGMVVLSWAAWTTWRGDGVLRRSYLVENAANYWHLVDLIWLFLWPMFYLMRGGV